MVDGRRLPWGFRLSFIVAGADLHSIIIFYSLNFTAHTVCEGKEFVRSIGEGYEPKRGIDSSEIFFKCPQIYVSFSCKHIVVT